MRRDVLILSARHPNIINLFDLAFTFQDVIVLCQDLYVDTDEIC